MVARWWGCERVAPQVSTGNRTRATIGTYPSCQRCCAASASHSGKTQGARPSPLLLTTLAPTETFPRENGDPSSLTPCLTHYFCFMIQSSKS